MHNRAQFPCPSIHCIVTFASAALPLCLAPSLCKGRVNRQKTVALLFVLRTEYHIAVTVCVSKRGAHATLAGSGCLSLVVASSDSGLIHCTLPSDSATLRPFHGHTSRKGIGRVCGLGLGNIWTSDYKSRMRVSSTSLSFPRFFFHWPPSFFSSSLSSAPGPGP